MSTVLDLNRRLATALGWSNIVDVGNALLGMPPWAIPHARGQCQVPNWAGCWKDCGPLIAAHMVNIRHAWSESDRIREINAQCVAYQTANGRGEMDGAVDWDAKVRFATVLAVIAKLEAAK